MLTITPGVAPILVSTFSLSQFWCLTKKAHQHDKLTRKEVTNFGHTFILINIHRVSIDKFTRWVFCINLDDTTLYNNSNNTNDRSTLTMPRVGAARLYT